MNLYDEDGNYIGPHVTVPNPEVLRAGVKHAEEHIANWDQRSWFHYGDRYPDGSGTCGTTACLAGHILLAQGKKWEKLSKEWIPEPALDALGLLREYRPDPNDRDNFNTLIFGYAYQEDVTKPLAFSAERMAAFKKHITDVTGVEFE